MKSNICTRLTFSYSFKSLVTLNNITDSFWAEFNFYTRNLLYRLSLVYIYIYILYDIGLSRNQYNYDIKGVSSVNNSFGNIGDRPFYKVVILTVIQTKINYDIIGII